MILEMINLYGMEVLGALLICLFGFFGMIAKRILDTPLKVQLARIAVQFAEQTCKALGGEEKLKAALAALSELLAQKHIRATESEMRILLESAVAEFNDVFHKNPAAN